MLIDAILLGGGEGKRFNSSIPKQFLELFSKPLLIYTIEAIFKIYPIRKIILIVPQKWINLTRSLVSKYFSESEHTIVIASGGNSRLESARCAIRVIRHGVSPDRLLIHDLCRCFLSNSFMARIREKIVDTSFMGWVPVIPISDTLKAVKNNLIIGTLDRTNLVRVQTPQIFDYNIYSEICFKIPEMKISACTDDASIFEHFAYPIGIFEGDHTNIKLTYPSELDILKMFLKVSNRTCDLESDMTFTV